MTLWVGLPSYKLCKYFELQLAAVSTVCAGVHAVTWLESNQRVLHVLGVPASKSSWWHVAVPYNASLSWVWSQNLMDVMCLLQTKDQTWTSGNLALRDSLCQQVPVRVVRGSHEKIKYASSLCPYVTAAAVYIYSATLLVWTVAPSTCVNGFLASHAAMAYAARAFLTCAPVHIFH